MADVKKSKYPTLYTKSNYTIKIEKKTEAFFLSDEKNNDCIIVT